MSKPLDDLADGEWDVETIAAGFDVPESIAETIKKMGKDASDVLQVRENMDDLTEWPGIGEAYAGSIRDTIPKLEARSVTRHGVPTDPDEDAEVYDPTQEFGGCGCDHD